MIEHIDILTANEAWRRWNEEAGETDDGHAVIAAQIARETAEAEIQRLKETLRRIRERILEPYTAAKEATQDEDVLRFIKKALMFDDVGERMEARNSTQKPKSVPTLEAKIKNIMKNLNEKS